MTESDPIITFVERHHSQWKNTGYSKKGPYDIGTGNIYTVSFIGENKEWRSNFVYERPGKELLAYSDLRDMLLDRSNGLITSYPSIEFIKVLAVILLALILTGAVIGIVWQNQDNKNLTLLTGFLGSTIGYLIGKSDSKH
jgi:hypothetical protein